MFSVLSWNIRQGGGSRIAAIIRKISETRPEVCILSEYRNNESGHTIRASLLRAGYRYQFVTGSASDDNSVLIASLLPCDSEQHPGSDPEFSGNILSVHFEVFSVMGVYLPHKKKHVLFDYIIGRFIAVSNPYIIAGDFNTGINHVDQAGDSFWYTEKLSALEKAGYTDAFRLKHGNDREYSWYSHQGNGYRYDHTWVHKSLAPLTGRCDYLHGWREEGLSDHSPMILTLG